MDSSYYESRLAKRGRSPLRPIPARSGAAPDGPSDGRRGRAADDAGFTPAEIIIGVILVGILATGVTIKAVQMMEQARDSAAQSTLRTAAAAADGVFGTILKGGSGNFAAIAVDPANAKQLTAATALYDKAIIGKAIEEYSKHEPNLSFKNHGDIASGGVGGLPPTGEVWVQINTKELKAAAKVDVAQTNPNGYTDRKKEVPINTAIRPGDLVRLGIISSGGSSFCLVRVADSTDGVVSGDGWQAVSEAKTLDTKPADCGADATGDAAFREMPQTYGTDPTLSSPTDNLGSSKGAEYQNS